MGERGVRNAEASGSIPLTSNYFILFILPEIF